MRDDHRPNAYWCLGLLLLLLVFPANAGQETFEPLGDQDPPKSFDELWAGYDPSSELLDTQVLHEWEQEGVVMRVVRFRLGLFKGKDAWLAGVYGFPKGEKNLPGLLQIHGGGQYAHHHAPLYNAKRGYATLSIAWAGRIDAPGYRVDKAGVARFWEGDPDKPGYRLTTDWGGVDGYHAPRRSEIMGFDSDQPGPWTLDPVASPRNNGWFLCTVAARRGLTFLEQQPEVDAERLGVYGHSMGGKITVMTAASDSRVKAAAPSCGGISHRDSKQPLYKATLGDDVCLKKIACPIIFLSPSNDFHGRIDDLPTAIDEIQSKHWRVTCSPHLNHRDSGEHAATAMLWFDQYLKTDFRFPASPKTKLALKAQDGVPVVHVEVDDSQPIEKIEVYYTQQGRIEGGPHDHHGTIHRFWHHAETKQSKQGISARLPLSDTTRPLWVYANVTYRLNKPVSGAGYYYGPYEADTFTISSVLNKAEPKALADASCRVTIEPTPVIEPFEGDWRKQWFTHSDRSWEIRTNKLNHPRWKAPGNASLVIELRSSTKNKLVVGIDSYATEVVLTGGDDWQRVALSPGDFTNALGQPLTGWSGIRQLRLLPAEHLRAQNDGETVLRKLGGAWEGAEPEFKVIMWEPGEKQAEAEKPGLNFGDPALVTVFPASTFNADEPGDFAIDSQFEPSPGPWMEGINERDVFRAALKHKQGPLDSYELRMGVGGQIYSLQGAFGESVPPSWRNDGPTSPWNDEVWQFVAVCTRYNMAREIPDWLKKAGPYQTTFFVHNSGCYIKDPGPGIELKNLYCPLLASGFDETTRAYRQVNWGMVPQMRSIHRSPIMFYTQVRDAGKGVIELTWVVHNFSTRDDVVFDYLNAPWGGTRVSALPLTYVATPEGKLMRDAPTEDSEGPFARGTDVRNTGGFTISSVDDQDNSPSLALVFGLDKHREAEAEREKQGEPYVQHRPTLYRSWRANGPAYRNQWKDFKNIPANSFRNYQVIEVIPKLNLRPQETVWYRSYLVVGGKQACVRRAKTLVEHVDYGSIQFTEKNTPMIDLPDLPGSESLQLYAYPLKGTLPVFKLRHKPTSKTIYTTDPYRFTPQVKLDLPVPEDDPNHDYFSTAVGYTLDGQTQFLGLMGYARREAPADQSNWVRLSEANPDDWDGKPSSFNVDVWVKKRQADDP